MPPMKRRDFLLSASAAATAPLLLPGCGSSTPSEAVAESMARARLPAPEDSGIDHIVLVMMENRSFDHMLGWVPGAAGKQVGMYGIDRAGVRQDSYPLATGHPSPWQGCGSADPNHGYEGGRIHLNGGKLDGWLLTDPTPLGDTLPLGYYRKEDLPFYGPATEDWTVCDNYHHALIAGTWPNRFYMHGGDNDFTDGDGIDKVSTIPTIWDALAEKGLTGRYYYGNLPFVGLWRKPEYMAFSGPLETFFADAAAGTLAPISYVDPIFESGAPNALSNDDHPHSDIRAGQFLLNRIYDALRNGPGWEKTLLIINYDEWGGFFDHVVPPVMPPSERDFATWQNDGLLGFRVPCLLIGPRVRRGHVCHDLLEPNAILNFFAWRFGLKAPGSRSRFSGNLATALDFDSPPRLDTRAYTVPAAAGLDCQRYSNWPQVDPPGGGLPPLPSGPSLPDGGRKRDVLSPRPHLGVLPDGNHVRQLRGLRDVARDMGFWIGPAPFPGEV